MADNQEPEPILLHEDTHKKDLISILGTQGLMYNDFKAHPINQGENSLILYKFCTFAP